MFYNYKNIFFYIIYEMVFFIKILLISLLFPPKFDKIHKGIFMVSRNILKQYNTTHPIITKSTKISCGRFSRLCNLYISLKKFKNCIYENINKPPMVHNHYLIEKENIFLQNT